MEAAQTAETTQPIKADYAGLDKIQQLVGNRRDFSSSLLSEVRSEATPAIKLAAIDRLMGAHKAGEEDKVITHIYLARVLGMEDETLEGAKIINALSEFYQPKSDETATLQAEEPEVQPVKEPSEIAQPRRGLTRRTLLKAASATVALAATAAATTLWQASKTSANEGRRVLTSDDLYGAPREPGGTTVAASPTPAPTASPSPTEAPATPEPTKEPTPEPDPEELAEKEVGQMNIIEYLLGATISRFMETRARRERDDPQFAEAVQIWDDNLNFVLAGIDETWERPDTRNGVGLGRADSIIVVSLNPHTLKAVSISIPRDLFVRELLDFTSKTTYGNKALDEGARINEVTTLSLVDGNVRTFQVLTRIVESLTGLPIDATVETNIDFWEGYFGPNADPQRGFFDAIFPDGLTVNVPKRVVDNAYPVGYGTETFIIEPGHHTMDGRTLTKYGRTRHMDGNFGRETRQRQIILEGLKYLFPRIVGELTLGRTRTLKTVKSALDQQVEFGNLFYNTNIINILGNLIGNLEDLRSSPKGLAMLSLLAANTRDQAANYVSNPGEMFTSVGLGDITTGIRPGEFGYNPKSALLKFAGTRTDVPPTKLGNYLAYAAPLRRKVKEAVQAASK